MKMKNLLVALALVFGVTTAHASEIENHVVCTPTLASVSVNGILDVDQTTKLINSAKGAGEFRARFEHSDKFKTVQSAADPHHTWIGIDDSVHETQIIAVMNFVTMTYTRTAYTKFWTHVGSDRNGVVHSITNHCFKKEIANDNASAKLPTVNLLGSN
tara:strand:+ start:4580 stop:5053 length:474 start_codon:yes stop_codon:yes gene_type:complete